MDAITSEVAKRFWEQCNWTYECWKTHVLLQEKFKHRPTNSTTAIYFFERLSMISLEYVFLQIAKLHDPAVQNNSLNLSIEYLITYGAWSDEDRVKLDELSTELNHFATMLRDARRKLIAHNDLEVSMKGEPLGAIDEGLYARYFETLQEFANRVYDRWIGGPYTFNDQVINDVEEFWSLLVWPENRP